MRFSASHTTAHNGHRFRRLPRDRIITRSPDATAGCGRGLAGGQATVSNTTLDIGTIGDIFGGNMNTLARTANINPVVVTLNFTTPQQPARSRINFLGGDSE